jgi:hypothetical protein
VSRGIRSSDRSLPCSTVGERDATTSRTVFFFSRPSPTTDDVVYHSSARSATDVVARRANVHATC